MELAEDSFYRLIVGQVPVGIIFADPDGIIELWNAESEAIFGYGTEEAIGKVWISSFQSGFVKPTGKVTDRQW